MKNWRKIMAAVLTLAMVGSMAACGAPAKTSSVAESSKPESSSKAASSAAESSAVSSAPAEPKGLVVGEDPGSLPRKETLYYAGIQWGAPINCNPFSSNPNNGMVVSQVDSARTLVYETLYMYNQNNGKTYPLLADGDYQWDTDRKVLTVKIKATAKWSDGTPVTAEDVAATFDYHVKVGSPMGTDYGVYIDKVTAVDAQTVTFTAKADNYNPLKVLEYLPKVYVLQKAYLDKAYEAAGKDAESFKNAVMEDIPYSGPYGVMFMSEQKVILQRNETYWGADASMWGKLPAPKYLAHNIYADNDAGRTALEQGEVDMSQQFMTNIWQMWESGLPVSTYINELPYYQCVTMPSIAFNTTKPGLDQKALRNAIAYAIDYDQVNQTAMCGYSPTFQSVPRSVMTPLETEQALIDKDALAGLQFNGKDYEKSKKVLDDAGIKDTDGDGIREFDGKNIELKAECPTGWNDWEASLEIVAAAGKEIGLNISTYFPEASVWQEDLQTGNFDIIMFGSDGASISSPWTRTFHLLNVADAKAERVFWGYHRMQNAEINDMLAKIPTETDAAKLKEYYTKISEFYLTETPAVALMYRPSLFHTTGETVWTNFQEQGDGTDIPPCLVSDGYGIAALYQLENVA